MTTTTTYNGQAYKCDKTPLRNQSANTPGATVSAVALVALGFRVVEVAGRSADDYTASKRPRYRGWQAGISDEQHLTRLHDYGVVVGPGELWLDPDTPTALAALRSTIPRIEQTWQANGGRGLPRFLVRLPAGERLGSRSNRALGLDVKGEGALMVVNSTFTDTSGVTYQHRPAAYVEPIQLTAAEYEALRSLLGNGITPTSTIPRNVEGFELAGAYVGLRLQWGRNDALYRAALRGRRRGLTAAELEAGLLNDFVHDAAPSGHKRQAVESRRREGLATIRSAVRAKIYFALAGEAVGLPESAREALLQSGRHQDARLLDALYICDDYQPGDRLAVNAVYRTLKELGLAVSKPTIVEALTRIGDTLPTPEAVCSGVNVEAVGYASVTLDDCQTVATYRDAMDRRLFTRRPGYYTLRWQAARVGSKARSTALRRRRRIGATVRQHITRARLSYHAVAALPENANDVTAGNPWQSYIECSDGSKLPAYKYAATNAMKRGKRGLTLVFTRVFVGIVEGGLQMQRNNNIVLPAASAPPEPRLQPPPGVASGVKHTTLADGWTPGDVWSWENRAAVDREYKRAHQWAVGLLERGVITPMPGHDPAPIATWAATVGAVIEPMPEVKSEV